MLFGFLELALHDIDLIAQCVRRFDESGAIGDTGFEEHIVPRKKTQFGLPAFSEIRADRFRKLPINRAHTLPPKSPRHLLLGVRLFQPKTITLALTLCRKLSGNLRPGRSNPARKI